MIPLPSAEEVRAGEKVILDEGRCIFRGDVAGQRRLWIADNPAQFIKLLLDEDPTLRDAVRLYAYHKAVIDAHLLAPPAPAAHCHCSVCELKRREAEKLRHPPACECAECWEMMEANCR